MDGIADLMTPALISSGIRLATPIMLAALGGALCNRAGVLNLALEGKMLLGAFVGIVFAFFAGNTYVGIGVAVLAGGLLGLLFAFLYLRYQVNLIILALAINMLHPGDHGLFHAHSYLATSAPGPIPAFSACLPSIFPSFRIFHFGVKCSAAITSSFTSPGFPALPASSSSSGRDLGGTSGPQVRIRKRRKRSALV